MVRRSSDPLSDSEWQVMKIVWNFKSCAVRDVYGELSKEFDWNQNTVRAFLNRLVDKGFVKTKQVGNCLVYRPARPFIRSICNAADDLLDKTLAGKAGPLLSYMVKNSELSQDEINELRVLLDQRAKEDES